MINSPDPADLSVGQILPFIRAKVPENWQIFDGRSLPADEFSELWEALFYAPHAVHDIFEQMGGAIGIKGIDLPNMTEAEAYAQVFGNGPYPGTPVVLAIKAKRDHKD